MNPIMAIDEAQTLLSRICERYPRNMAETQAEYFLRIKALTEIATTIYCTDMVVEAIDRGNPI